MFIFIHLGRYLGMIFMELSFQGALVCFLLPIHPSRYRLELVTIYTYLPTQVVMCMYLQGGGRYLLMVF